MQSGWRIEIFGTVEGVQQLSPAAAGEALEGQSALSIGPEWENRRLSVDKPVAVIRTIPDFKGLGRLLWFGLYWSAQEKGVTRPGGYMGTGIWALNCTFDPGAAIETLLELRAYVAAHAMVDNRFTCNLTDIPPPPQPRAAKRLIETIAPVPIVGRGSRMPLSDVKSECPVIFADPTTASSREVLKWALSDFAWDVYGRVIIGMEPQVGDVQIAGCDMHYHRSSETLLTNELARWVKKAKSLNWHRIDLTEKVKELQLDKDSLHQELEISRTNVHRLEGALLKAQSLLDQKTEPRLIQPRRVSKKKDIDGGLSDILFIIGILTAVLLIFLIFKTIYWDSRNEIVKSTDVPQRVMQQKIDGEFENQQTTDLITEQKTQNEKPKESSTENTGINLNR
jgi:hypothetical protein